ncbi:hypothetical protein CDV31_006265 [Fusarium ambrosium]|uniref:Uncharacterized protein n=1 Tax=Fusarium ambrosium TaxID=131363 RepID=A0A428UEF7_9HYPO|nr:hypothetical protein CDV31_006265 [Fusarium ambrosium]
MPSYLPDCLGSKTSQRNGTDKLLTGKAQPLGTGKSPSHTTVTLAYPRNLDIANFNGNNLNSVTVQYYKQ